MATSTHSVAAVATEASRRIVRTSAAAISLTSANQKLEIGASGSLTISAAQSVVSVRLRRNPLRGSDLGRAEGAAASRERDLAQALGAVAGGGVGRRFAT